MSYEIHNGLLTVFLSPALRGTPDSVRKTIESLLRSDATFWIASQQVSDRSIVDALTDVRSERGERAYVLIESDYLYERKPLPVESVWNEGGEREGHRQCFLALIRSGIKIRGDLMEGALQHVNMVIAKNKDSLSAFITSANLSPGSLDQHLNWGVSIADRELCEALLEAFKQAWDGDFRDVFLDQTKQINGDALLSLNGGSRGQAVDPAVKAIEASRESVHFAYFNLSDNSRVAEALSDASKRGVRVAGVVDGDQQGAAWDAVPLLRSSGVDARYYPGALTGAIGRMHYKMMVIDRSAVHLTTANASRAAETSFELGITVHGGGPAKYIEKEINRLFTHTMIPEDGDG